MKNKIEIDLIGIITDLLMKGIFIYTILLNRILKET
jgi:hypothetical protein